MHGLMRDRYRIYIVAAILSVLLSVWGALTTTVVNPDGICYLQSAETVSQGLTLAMKLCGQAQWPFYSVLISGIAKWSSLSSITSAFILNGVLTLISVLSFVAIARFLCDLPRVMWLAAGVILLAHEFNSLRSDVIRDHGFWAFYLVSILLLLHYFRARHWNVALAWSASLVVATLFRIEGAVFLLGMPFIALFAGCGRIKSFLQLNTVTLLGGVLLVFWVMTHQAHGLSRLNEVQFQLLHGLGVVQANFQKMSTVLSQSILSGYTVRDAGLVLIFMLIGWYLLSAIQNVSMIYAVLIVYAWHKRISRFNKTESLVLLGYVSVNVLITAVFLIENMFLSKRYLIALSLVLMVWVPFALEDLFEQWRLRKWPLILAVFFVLTSGLGGIIGFGYSKQYIRDAGDWLAVNTATTAKIYSNDYQVMYYSKHFNNAIFNKSVEYVHHAEVIASGKWRKFDYVALRLNKHDTDNTLKIAQQIPFSPVQIFKNKRGDEVSIYKIEH